MKFDSEEEMNAFEFMYELASDLTSKRGCNDLPKEELAKYFNPVIEFFLIVISMSIIAYWINYPTLYFVALAIGLGWPVAELLDPYTGSVLAGTLAFGISGLAILIYGLVRFIKFIKRHPKQNISADYEKPE